MEKVQRGSRPRRWKGLVRVPVVLLISTAAVLCGASPTASASISGSLSDWLAAVCQPGHVFDTNTRYAVAGNTCEPRSGNGYVVFDFFKSRADRELIMSVTNGHIALFESGGLYGAIWNPSRDGSAMAPLRQFGFDIQARTGTAPRPSAATPGTNSPVEQQFLTATHQYLGVPRPPDGFILQLGRQVCQIRHDGGSSDDAEVAIWNTWNASGLGVIPSGAETGSLVHSAIDNLCPEVGYP